MKERGRNRELGQGVNLDKEMLPRAEVNHGFMRKGCLFAPGRCLSVSVESRNERMMRPGSQTGESFGERW